MLDKVCFKFGAGPGRPTLTFKPELMTIFVGPNNSGKSRALNEIYTHFKTGFSHLRVIDKVEVRKLSEEEIGELLTSGVREISIPDYLRKTQDIQEPSPVKRTQMARLFNPIAGEMVGRELEAMQRMLGSSGLTDEKCSIVCHLAIRLGGLERLILTSPKPVSNLQEHPTSILMALFQDGEARNRLRNMIFDIFGFYITVDATDMKHFRLRMSGRPPHDPSEECALDRRAVEFHRDGVEFELASDGVKAFTGLMAAVLCADTR